MREKFDLYSCTLDGICCDEMGEATTHVTVWHGEEYNSLILLRKVRVR
jgi:hypothetical protein